jgi:hypothetical protein
MPCIVSDFAFFGGVGFNLFYCYEIPDVDPLVERIKTIYTLCWVLSPLLLDKPYFQTQLS